MTTETTEPKPATTRELPASVRAPSGQILAMDADQVANEFRPRGGLFDDMFGTSQARQFTRAGAAAVVDVCGPLDQRGSWFYQGYDEILSAVSAALGDVQSDGVILRVNSPGGVCAGLGEAAREIRAAADRAGKPIVAYVDEAAFSAAYWLASLADEIILPRSGGVGSVGVIAALRDYSKALEAAGVRYAVVASGTTKTDSHPAVPITDAAIGRLRAEVNYLADAFFEVVAERRGMTVESVKALQAACFLGQKAVEVGLADSVGSFGDAVQRISALASARAEDKQHMATKEAVKVEPELAEPTMSVTAHSAAMEAQADKFTATIEALKSSLSAAEKSAGEAKALLDESRKVTASLDAKRLEAKVDGFVGTKLTPAERDKWIAMATKDEAQFDSLIADRPDLGALGARVIDPKGNEERSTDSAVGERKLAKFHSLVAEKVKAGMDKNEAMTEVLNEHPELAKEEELPWQLQSRQRSITAPNPTVFDTA